MRVLRLGVLEIVDDRARRGGRRCRRSSVAGDAGPLARGLRRQAPRDARGRRRRGRRGDGRGRRGAPAIADRLVELPAADDQVWPMLGAPVAPVDWTADASPRRSRSSRPHRVRRDRRRRRRVQGRRRHRARRPVRRRSRGQGVLHADRHARRDPGRGRGRASPPPASAWSAPRSSRSRRPICAAALFR